MLWGPCRIRVEAPVFKPRAAQNRQIAALSRACDRLQVPQPYGSDPMHLGGARGIAGNSSDGNWRRQITKSFYHRSEYRLIASLPIQTPRQAGFGT